MVLVDSSTVQIQHCDDSKTASWETSLGLVAIISRGFMWLDSTPSFYNYKWMLSIL